eukprot:Nk52_evm14s675 gene=Nk52_evmTU14s675
MLFCTQRRFFMMICPLLLLFLLPILPVCIGANLRDIKGCVTDGTAFTCSDENGASDLGDLSNYDFDCTGLASITFSNTGITSIPNGFFSSCRNSVLSEFEISSETLLTEISSETFSGLFSTNGVTQSFRMKGLTNLKALPANITRFDSGNIEITHNGIETVGYPLFDFGGPFDFNASWNKLKEFHAYKAFEGASNPVMTVCDLSGNQLKTLGDYLPSVLQYQNSLVFNLSHNLFTNATVVPQSSVFQTICSAQGKCTLDLSHNQILNVPSAIYQGRYSLYLNSNPMHQLNTMLGRPRVTKVSLADTPNLHYIPTHYLKYFDSSGVMIWGDFLSCCGIGRDNLGYYQGSTSSLQPQKIVCIHNTQQYRFYAADLITRLQSDPNWCNCSLASCAPATTPGIEWAKCDVQQTDYTLCDCSDPLKCYLWNQKSPMDYGEDPNSSDPFTSSVAFYITLVCVIVVVICALGGLLFWLHMKNKRKKAEEHIYAYGDELYQGPGEREEGDLKRKNRGSSAASMEAFGDPIEGGGRGGHFDEVRFAHAQPEMNNFAFTDETGMYLELATPDVPPDVPDRNEGFTIGNIRKLSIADKTTRVDQLVEEAVVHGDEGDVYDPLELEGIKDHVINDDDNNPAGQNEQLSSPDMAEVSTASEAPLLHHQRSVSEKGGNKNGGKVGAEDKESAL